MKSAREPATNAGERVTVAFTVGAYLERRGLKPIQLARASHGALHHKSAYDLAAGKPVRTDLETLAKLIRTLEALTGERVELGDILHVSRGDGG